MNHLKTDVFCRSFTSLFSISKSYESALIFKEEICRVGIIFNEDEEIIRFEESDRCQSMPVNLSNRILFVVLHHTPIHFIFFEILV
jgi:hypothetical protein